MNVAAFAQSTYGAHARTVKTPRDIEYDVLARITARLRRATAPDGGTFPELVSALDENARLWTAFASDLAHPDNLFPDELRARLFSLGQFTLAHTGKVLSGQASADALIEINTAVMRGLRAASGALS
jgi:flagellar biosynthesis activator protein FlaF